MGELDSKMYKMRPKTLLDSLPVPHMLPATRRAGGTHAATAVWGWRPWPVGHTGLRPPGPCGCAACAGHKDDTEAVAAALNSSMLPVAPPTEWSCAAVLASRMDEKHPPVPPRSRCDCAPGDDFADSVWATSLLWLHSLSVCPEIGGEHNAVRVCAATAARRESTW
jgi:hypothetical protein